MATVRPPIGRANGGAEPRAIHAREARAQALRPERNVKRICNYAIQHSSGQHTV
jgi:hypothetical protein